MTFPNVSEQRLLDVVEVAKILGVSKQMIYKLEKNGDLPCVQIGRRKKFRPEDIEKYIDDNISEYEEVRNG